jgi:hypothetical protein
MFFDEILCATIFVIKKIKYTLVDTSDVNFAKNKCGFLSEQFNKLYSLRYGAELRILPQYRFLVIRNLYYQ